MKLTTVSKTTAEEIAVLPVRNFVDPRDSNNYVFTVINNKKWFVDDLRYVSENAHFKSGDTLENGNFYTHIDAPNACPEGWRLPEIKDFEALIFYLEKSQNVDHNKIRVNEKRSKLTYKNNKLRLLGFKNPIGLQKEGRIDKGKHVTFGWSDYWVGDNKSQFTHTHIVNGNVIIHSHTKQVVKNQIPIRLFKIKCVCELQ